jgi:DNA-binding GntR family transcriptional regulator
MLDSLSDIQLDGGSPLRDQVYPILRELIIKGKIRPGELIDDKRIATLLNISRTPVREAVKRLNDENLVTVVAQSATRASQLSFHDIEESYLLRRALEMESAAQAATKLTQEDIDNLSHITARHAQLIERKKFSNALKVDDEFHKYITTISGLHRFWKMIDVSKAQLDRCRHIMLSKVGEGETTIEHHLEIIRALNSRDPERARLSMRKHLDAAFDTTAAMLRETDLSFPPEPKPGGRAKRSTSS